MDHKIQLCVVFGGQSGEHEVSRISATNVLEAINQDKYDITVVGITKKGVWCIYSGDYQNIGNGTWEEDRQNVQENIHVFEALKDIDIFFPVMHGPMCEDGTIQGVFEMLNKPYVGNGVLGAAVGMDKVISKILFTEAGIPTGPYIYFRKRDWLKKQAALIEKAEATLNYPMFVKPVDMGSSVGISKAHNQSELIKGIKEALRYDHKIIVEEGIDGYEVECAVLEDQDEIKAAIPGQVDAASEFYDYDAKYNSGDNSKITIPAPLEEDILKQVQAYAIKAFDAIECSGLTRVDFFVQKSDHKVLINEVNTLPGFTNISMYPKMWEASGIAYVDLVEKIIQSASCKRIYSYDTE